MAKLNCYILYGMFTLLLCVSCGNNKMSIDAENATIIASDGQIFKRLSVTDDSASYEIMKKDGYKGGSTINLNQIDEAYTIYCNFNIIRNDYDDSIANKDFRLLPNREYEIINHSEPDAGEQAISFLTNSCANIKMIL